MRVVVAPDKFEGSLGAGQAAAAIAAGLRRARPDAEVVSLPLGDGGAGTLEALLAAGFERVPVRASGPTGEPVDAAIAVDGRRAPGGPGDRRGGPPVDRGGPGGSSLGLRRAFVEMAEASGLKRLPGGRRAPLAATSFGTGELLAAALDGGARELVLGIGGSATTDGGAGMATALGARLLDRDGAELPPGGAALLRLARVDVAGLDQRLRQVRVTVACDVDNPLVGPEGAAAVYGPQKGAGPDEVLLLDSALRRYARVLADDLGLDLAATPGAGAAGGLGAGAIAFLGAELRPGIELVLELVGFDRAVAGADLVVTGEGKLDAQSLHGKAPVGVARAAGAHGVPVVALAGAVEVADRELRAAGFEEAHALAELEPDPERSMAEAAPLLERLAERVGRAWASLP
jgi:glycerate 2-kinase